MTECEEQARLLGMSGERELALRAEIERLRAALAEAREAIDQALDDMGKDGLCVCGACKDQLRAALARIGAPS